MNQPHEELSKRVARIEDTLEIQQLAVRYAMCVDERDVDGWLELFVPDVNVGRAGVGREALRGVIAPQLRHFYRSIHQIVGHRIDLLGDADAVGAVYCRAEHEVGDRWVVIPIRYDDRYRKVGGRWCFERRVDKHFYEADLVERPQDVAFHGWPGVPQRPRLPEPSASWTAFWRDVDTSSVTGHPVQPATEETA